jgi:hypothetical protein
LLREYRQLNAVDRYRLVKLAGTWLEDYEPAERAEQQPAGDVVTLVGSRDLERITD